MLKMQKGYVPKGCLQGNAPDERSDSWSSNITKQFKHSSDEVVERECCLVLRELGVEPARFILCNIPDSGQSGAGWLYLPMSQFLYCIIPCSNDDFYCDFWQLTLIHIVKPPARLCLQLKDCRRRRQTQLASNLLTWELVPS